MAQSQKLYEIALIKKASDTNVNQSDTHVLLSEIQLEHRHYAKTAAFKVAHNSF